ncbi:MAG: SAM-dependent methyltransferase, partial [Verrucomicrobia bacterium]|nr:SAM-dependent methyltransferase [Verrucomicrobiota bacterium]
CGIRTDFLDFTVDRNPYKHGRYLPGTHIPIHSVDWIRKRQPDYILILPWNLKDEIIAQLGYARGWGAKFIVAIPVARVLG